MECYRILVVDNTRNEKTSANGLARGARIALALRARNTPDVTSFHLFTCYEAISMVADFQLLLLHSSNQREEGRAYFDLLERAKLSEVPWLLFSGAPGTGELEAGRLESRADHAIRALQSEGFPKGHIGRDVFDRAIRKDSAIELVCPYINNIDSKLQPLRFLLSALASDRFSLASWRFFSACIGHPTTTSIQPLIQIGPDGAKPQVFCDSLDMQLTQIYCAACGKDSRNGVKANLFSVFAGDHEQTAQCLTHLCGEPTAMDANSFDNDLGTFLIHAACRHRVDFDDFYQDSSIDPVKRWLYAVRVKRVRFRDSIDDLFSHSILGRTSSVRAVFRNLLRHAPLITSGHAMAADDAAFFRGHAKGALDELTEFQNCMRDLVTT